VEENRQVIFIWSFFIMPKKKDWEFSLLGDALRWDAVQFGGSLSFCPKRCLNKPRTGAFWGFNILVKLQIQLVPGRIQAGNGTRN
jgi:hypothetical protein